MNLAGRSLDEDKTKAKDQQAIGDFTTEFHVFPSEG